MRPPDAIVGCRRGLVLSIAALLVCACSSSSSTAPSSGPPIRPAARPAAAGTLAGATLKVFAAASLTEAFNAAKTMLVTRNPGLAIAFSFAGSNTLAAQLNQGAPVDVIALADTKTMTALATSGLVDTPITFARNKLEIAVAPGNPKHIASVADMARPDLSVVLAAPGVPAGDYTRRVLADQNIVVVAKSLETDVKSAMAKVISGEADATVVYRTDVMAAGPAVSAVTVPDASQPDITYPIAVVHSTHNRAAATAFLQSAVTAGGQVQLALEQAGFLPPQ